MQAAQCRPLLERLRKKLSRGEPLSGVCRLSKLTSEQRRAISALTGANSRGPSLTIDLAAFEQVVQNTGRFASLRELVEQAAGQRIENQRAARSAQQAGWSEVWQEAESRVREFPSVRDVLRQLRKSGWLSRVACRDSKRGGRLLTQALELLGELPVRPTPLAIFATEKMGDAHALDPHFPLGRLLLRFVAAREGLSYGKRSAARRLLWESVGIVPDELSASALVLNLPAIGDDMLNELLRIQRAAGLPHRLTFRHLRLHCPGISFQHANRSRSAAASEPAASVESSTRSASFRPFIFVCENPSIIAAAADRLGTRCPPLVCVEGQPTLTCLTLLSRLCQLGYELKYHGDFDWGGLRIANRIYAAVGFVPWRFSAADYQVTSANHRKLRPPASEAIWDKDLAAKIRSAGVAIEEESLIELLIGDLSR